jgi:hypothetical protein
MPGASEVAGDRHRAAEQHRFGRCGGGCGPTTGIRCVAKGIEMSTSTQHSSSRRSLLICAAVVVLLLDGTFVAQTGLGRGALQKLGLYAPSEPIVALSFANPTRVANDGVVVPTTPPRTVPVAFTIANATPQAEVFAARVTAGGRLAATSQLRIPARLHATARATIGPVCIGRPIPQRVRVVVTLVQPARSIDFWVRCRG